MKTTTVTARIDPNLKSEAEKILSRLGVTHSQAINMLYSLIVLRKRLPSEMYGGTPE